MGEESLGFWTEGRVDVEALLDEGVELHTPFGRLLQTLHWLVLQLPHRHQGLEVGVGHYPFCQLDGGDPQRPNVGLVGVEALLHDFGTHPVRGADLGFVACVGVHALGGDSEVCEFGESLLVEQYVGGLDVSVYLFVFVEVDEPLEY